MGTIKEPPPLKDLVRSLPEVLAAKIPEREYVIENFIRTRSLTMVYAHRGVGKTWFVMDMALSIARGEPFVGYPVPKLRRVLIVDGEMPLADTQERFKAMVGADGTEMVTILSAETLSEHGHPRLALSEVPTQNAIKHLLGALKEEGKEPEVIILDNLSSLQGTGLDENSNTDMAGMMQFMVDLRLHGYTVVFVHHTGKDKSTQRGASKIEDFLDTSIFLEAVPNSRANGAEFKMSFTKLRGKWPSPRERVLTLMPGEHGLLEFMRSTPKHERYVPLIRAIHGGELRQVDVGAALEMSKSGADHLVQDAKKEGLITGGKGMILELTTAGVVVADELPF